VTRIARLGFSCLLVLACTLGWRAPSWAACIEGQGLALLHFNDFHGQLEPYPDPQTQAEVGGIARLAAAVAAVRAEDPARPVVLLFAGDLLQGTVTSSLFLGIPDLALFERMGVDAAVMGNHELDYGQEVFRHLAGLSAFPWLTANVETHPDPLPVKPAVILAKPGGPKVAVLGLTTPELTTATHPRNIYGVSVEEPIAAARRLVPGLEAEADLVVVLSHMGIADDRRLAAEVPQVDVIVGGHNHNLYVEPVMVGDVAILQAGERGHWLGRMDLACRDGHLVRTGYRILTMDTAVPQDPVVAAEVARVVREAEQGLAEAVGETAVELSARREVIRRGEALFGDWVADLARDITQADLALFNGGGFRATIPAGTVTLKHIYQAFPFRNELVVGGLTGTQVLATLQRSAALDPLDNPGGFLQVSGVRYTIAADGSLADVSLGGRPMDPSRVYRVVTSDFLAAGGDGYAGLQQMQDKVMTGRLISDMVIEAFRIGGTPAPQLDGRIRRLAADPNPAPGETQP
jgi:5'-nucleotidase / UDP-sugar diphosphatase